MPVLLMLFVPAAIVASASVYESIGSHWGWVVAFAWVVFCLAVVGQLLSWMVIEFIFGLAAIPFKGLNLYPERVSLAARWACFGLGLVAGVAIWVVLLG
ncbi:MAG: hypothetical protein ACXIUZ_00570 [Lysobacteraceae bacterium]